jgi:DNA-binding transcriptional LysR family regulator
VTIELGFNDRYVDLLKSVGMSPYGSGASPTVRLLPASSWRCASCCAAPSYLARRTPTRLADLGDHDCLGHTNASLAGTTSWAFGKDRTIKVPISGSMCSDNGEALVRAAIAGQGLVYGPRFIAAEALRAGQLGGRLDEPPMMLGAAYAITHPTRRPAAKTERGLTS